MAECHHTVKSHPASDQTLTQGFDVPPSATSIYNQTTAQDTTSGYVHYGVPEGQGFVPDKASVKVA